MTLDLPSGKYKLWIHHEGLKAAFPLPKDFKRTDGGHPVRARTVARLETDDGTLLAEAHALCSASDQFKKKDGVRLAVTRLITAAAISRRSMFPKAERAIIWKRVWNLK
jgi:hypothetical protein